MTIELPKGISLHRGKLRIAFRVPGEKNQTKRSLGIEPTKTNVKHAAMKLGAIKHDIMLGTFTWAKHFPNDRKVEQTELRLKYVLDKYFLNHPSSASWKLSTRLAESSLVDSIMRRLGNIRLDNLKPSEVAKIREDLSIGPKEGEKDKPRKVGITRINKYMSVISKSLDRVVFEGLLETNPFSNIEPLKVVKSADALEHSEYTDVYTIEEALRISEAMPSDNLRRLFTFLFWSGVRHGEAVALRREDICLPYIIIRRTLTQIKNHEQTPKTGQSRKIYLTSCARLAIEQQLQTHNKSRVWLNSKDREYIKSTILHPDTWQRVCERAKVKRLVPYTTRHSFASWQLMAGESEMEVAAHLGHINTTMVRERYGKYIPSSEPSWKLDNFNNVVELSKKMRK